MKKTGLILIVMMIAAGCAHQQAPVAENMAPATRVDLIPAGSVWFYDDTGTDLGTAWRTGRFSTTSGPAELGYGDGDVVTPIRFGQDPSGKHPTYYFRRSFNIANLGEVRALKLSIVRDDGAVVYINGTEVARSNMSGGEITYYTWVSNYVPSAEENTWHPYTVPKSVLVEGENIIAVEVHQAHGASSDVSFDLRLTQNP